MRGAAIGAGCHRVHYRELQGEEVDLEFDEDRDDRYDRLLAYVHNDGEMFNETLLEEGYAQVYIVSPNDRYEDRFEEAQEEAQAAQRGIWALPAAEQPLLTHRGNGIGGDGCAREETTALPKAPSPPEPTPDPAPSPDPIPAPTPEPTPTPDVPPAPGGGGSVSPAGNSCPPNAPIKGNQSGIYHPPGSRSYNVTNPEECFATEADAQAAGYRAPKR